MALIVAIHNYGPEIRKILAERGGQMIQLSKEVYPQIVWRESYVEWATGKVVCIWEAPSVAAVKAHFAKMGTPYNDVFEAEWGTPHAFATAKIGG